MSETREIQVVPTAAGTWYWRYSDNPDEGFDTSESRADVIAAAREANGRKNVEVRDDDGELVGEGFVGGKLRVVLLRPDGSEYGELDPPASETSGPVKQVTLVPAVETSDPQNTEVTHG